MVEGATRHPPPLLDKSAILTVVPKPLKLKYLSFTLNHAYIASSLLKVRLSSYLYGGNLNRNVIMDVSRKI